MYNFEKCALCQSEDELKESHIIPKFVARHLKKTALGGIRSSSSPNRPIQDSEKHYMLCGKCEGKFSKRETIFANHIFYPYQKKATHFFNYDEMIYFCVTSISWRTLCLEIMDFKKQNKIDKKTLKRLEKFEKKMRLFLLDEHKHSRSIENHIFLCDNLFDLIGNNPILGNKQPNVTLKRGIWSYTFFNDKLKVMGVITNLMGIILVTLYKQSNAEIWDNTQIFNSEGELKCINQKIGECAEKEICFIIENTDKYSLKISSKQEKIIIDKLEKNYKKISNSAILNEWRKDFDLIRKKETEK